MLTHTNGSLTRRGRLLRTAVGFGVVVAALVFGPQAVAGDAPGASDVSGAAVADPYLGFDTYTVAQGESLWDIAINAAPAGSDPQVAVRRIMEANGFQTSAVRAGQQILLPPLA